jgi:CheY-like chemotaxis protein
MSLFLRYSQPETGPHTGHIGLNGGQLGKGSTFTMELPVEVGRREPAQQPVPAAPMAPVPAGQHRVLVIDDDPKVQRLIEITLKPEGYALRFASDGREWLRLAWELRPAVITLDVLMPDMEGFAVLAEMRKRDDYRQIPVVVITAKDLTQEERERLRGQTEKILEKGSFVRVDLLREVRNCVARFRSA